MDKFISDKQEAGVKSPLFTIINNPSGMDYDTSNYFFWLCPFLVFGLFSLYHLVYRGAFYL